MPIDWGDRLLERGSRHGRSRNRRSGPAGRSSPGRRAAPAARQAPRHAPHDGPHPPVRGAGAHRLPGAEDAGLHPLLCRRGGGRDRRLRRARARRPHHLDASRPRPCHRQGRRPRTDDGGALRQGDRHLLRPRRLDAHRRLLARHARRQRHRRRRLRPCRRRRACRRRFSRHQRRDALLLRRRRHQQGHLPRGDELRRHPPAAGDLPLREQSVRPIHRGRAG